ncbi:methyltransferase domain-containing protein [Actinomadura citrea]|uniref:class I SAM-dependent methyltransferase n=1 Tax=Actinomadura citrea TaxID=46158 RepID=UPI002E28E488|nr:methyltransferase domain-containing protein [Actinomadura citrea]
MPHPATAVQETGGTIAPHLRRLLEFVEPHTGDVCLDVARGRGPMPAALGPHVRHVTAVDATPVAAASAPARPGRMETVEFGTGPVRITGGARGPDGARDAHDDGGRARPRDPAAMTREDPRPRPPRPAPRDPVKADATALPYRDNTFSLVTARFSLYNLGDPGHVLRELLRVCRPGGGRVVIADLVRGNLAGPERDRIERLRDPDHPGTPSIARLTEMITSVGGSIRRLDVFTVERPVEPWLAGARDDAAADRIRAAMLDEVDGGPRTGAKPRVIGGELWFTQSWAHVAAEPIP